MRQKKVLKKVYQDIKQGLAQTIATIFAEKKYMTKSVTDTGCDC
jgi:hypothetical protein